MKSAHFSDSVPGGAKLFVFAIGMLSSAALLLQGCGSGGVLGPVPLKGAGSTALNVIFSRWVTEFNKSDGSVDLSYQATGSGDGIRQLEAGTADFAATDMLPDDAEMSKFTAKLLILPALTGAVVPVYNLPGMTKEIKFNPQTLAGIFSGKIMSWSDPALAQDNAELDLPAQMIHVLHRSDSSGTTYNFTDFLSQTNPPWQAGPGVGGTVQWPVGEGANGNDALADKVKATPFSIGYVEVNYAIQKKLTYGSVRNSAGKFLKPDLTAQNAAVRAKPEFENDFRTRVVNTPAKEAYPITTISWLLVPATFKDSAKGRAMKRFLSWTYGAGLDLAMPLDYGLLPPEILETVRGRIQSIK